MISIGITGGLGSGKSVVARLLALQGIPVYIADDESKRLTAHSPLIRQPLTELFGDELYTDEGLNKSLLASLIFSDAENLKRVNAIIHPVVSQDFQQWVQRQSGPYCALESAILYESGFDQLVDVRLMVYAPLELRLQRAMVRDRADRETLLARIRHQWPDEVKKERADFVIYNDDQQALIPQIQDFLSYLQPSITRFGVTQNK